MPKKILIIDDERDICDGLKRWLEREYGYEVDAVTSVESAFEKIKSQPYDLLIVDILLQGFNSGLDVIAHFTDKPARPKIIIMTAVVADDLQRPFREKGIVNLIDAILKKPDDVMPDKIIAAVQKAIG